MSIARVPGYSLLSNLDRQGIDLQFTTTGNTLTYMDFTNFRFGINTVAPTQALDVVGNVRISGNILTVGNLLANIGNVTNWYRTVHANSIISTSLTGTIQTAAQPNITQIGTLANLTVTGNVSAGNITVSGGIGISGNVTVSNMTANTYTGNIVTANQPFITNLANISLTSLTATGNVSANWLVSNNANISSIYGNILTANQPFITNLANVTVTNITVNSNLRITGNTTAGNVSANVITENGFRVLTSNTNVIVTGDTTGSGNISNISLTLVNTGVTAGTYGASTVVPTIVVDSKGRITSAANVILTKVGNVDFNNTTLTTTGNLTLQPSSNIVDAGNSRLANVATPIENTDAVNLTYLNSALSAAANLLTAGDSVVRLTDAGAANLSTVLDNTLTSVSTSSATTFYHAVTAGALTINGNTISSTANIVLNTPSGIVQILGTDAVGLPAGGTGDRPSGALLGYTRFNTDTDLLETWDGNTWASPGVQTITSETINPDGIANTFTLSSNVNSAYGVLVSINGTLQQPVTAYDVVGNQISFTEIPQDSDIIEVRTIAAGVVVSGLQYGATEIQLTTGNVNVTGNLLPTANVIYDIGSDTLRWRDLYLAGNTINLGGATISAANGVLAFTPAGGNAVNLSTDIDPSLLYSTNTNVKVTNNYVNVAIAGSNVAAFRSSGLQLVGNISADGFNYSNGVSILDGVISLVTSNASVQAGLISELTSNAAVQAGLITSAVSQANANTSNANVAMKGYVDAINSTLTANAAVQAGAIAGIQTNYANLSGATFTGTVTIPTLTLSNPLAVNQGGTGATTTSGIGGVLDNLLPSGEQTGYVLKTSGAGTYFWAAEGGGGGGVVGQQLITLRQANTATSGQTIFNLVGGTSYVPGTGQLRVYVNGVRQFPDAYTETSNVSYTLTTGVQAGTVVFAEIDSFSSFNNYANLTYASNIGNIAAVGLTVQSAINSLETTKAPLTAPVFTGNVTAGNVVASSFTYANGVSILSDLYANAAVQAGQIATLTSNAAVQAGDIATLFANAGAQSGSIATLTSNAAVQAGLIADLTSNAAVQAGLIASKADLTGATFTGSISTTNLSVSGLTTLAETTEILDTKSSVTGTVVHDFSTSAIWYYSNIAGNVTANITNVPTTDNRVTSVSIVVNQGATGYIVNGLQINGAAQTIRWQANTVPTASTNRIDVFTFSLIRAASAWTVLGSATSHG